MNMSRVFVKELDYAFVTLQICCFDVTVNSVQRWDIKVGVFSNKKVGKFRIRDDGYRLIAFGYPFRNVGTDIHDKPTQGFNGR